MTGAAIGLVLVAGLLLAGYLRLRVRFAALSADHFDMLASLNGDIARRKLTADLLRRERDAAVAARAEDPATIAAQQVVIEALGEALDEAAEEIEMLWRAIGKVSRRADGVRDLRIEGRVS